MSAIKIKIDASQVTVDEGVTVLDAARRAGIYIPSLCAHPDLPPGGQCKLCIVQINGELVKACETLTVEGMEIDTRSAAVQSRRRDNLALILANHPHACLTCAQREGCSRTQCSSNVPVPERCCAKFSNCEVRKVSDYIGIKPDTPRYVYAGLPVRDQEPLIFSDPNLCIDCSRCVRACKEIRGVGALTVVERNGRRFVDVVNTSFKDSGCRFCTACIEVCPTGALMDKTISLARRETEIVPCRANCPAGIDIPWYLRYIAQGKFAEATAVIREKVPFPEVLGTVCFHPCETVCRRGEVSEPVAICSLKRFAAENDSGLWKARAKKAPATGKKVAIVGSGPAGLTAAYYLAKAGHSVTVFEALPTPGGMMRVGIPAYRLPRTVLDKEIAEIASFGVEIVTNTPIGRNGLSIDELRRRGYEALLIAAGAHKPKRLNILGESLKGVLDCVDLLREVALGKAPGIGKRVVVIGGGNAAIDAARTALRLGAENVSIYYRRTAKDMPANKPEIEDALGEGVQIEYLASPVRILGSEHVSGVQFIRMQVIGTEADGRSRAVPIPDSDFIVSADTVITAIGQECDPTCISGETEILLRNGTIAVDETMMTTKRGVFATGDAVKAPGSVIEAIAAGRKAASAIDKFLGGTGDIDEVLIERDEPSSWLGREDGFSDRRRIPMPRISDERRKTTFDQVELGYDAQMAIAEAKRCLQCDLRLRLTEPLMPPEEWLEFNATNIAAIPMNIDGVYQLLDENKQVLKIKGTAGLRQALEAELETNKKAKYFVWEEDPMFTKRESELISHYIQEHGKMPEGDDELDDLF